MINTECKYTPIVPKQKSPTLGAVAELLNSVNLEFRPPKDLNDARILNKSLILSGTLP
jgi:hypothetical protein